MCVVDKSAGCLCRVLVECEVYHSFEVGNELQYICIISYIYMTLCIYSKQSIYNLPNYCFCIKINRTEGELASLLVMRVTFQIWDSLAVYLLATSYVAFLIQ